MAGHGLFPSSQVFEANLKDSQQGFNWRDTLKSVMHVAGVLGRCAIDYKVHGRLCGVRPL